MNYASLIELIKSYANRNEQQFIDAIPDIINQAMNRIYSEGTCIGFQKKLSGTMTIGNSAINKPTDYKSTINLEIFNLPLDGTSTFLQERTYEFCKAYSPVSTKTGMPVFYSTDLIVPAINVGPAQLFLSPTPDKKYTYILNYLSTPPAFDNNNPTNYITDRYPNLLIYACMVEAIPYLKSDERIPVFESLYNRALQGLNKDTESRYTDRLTQRNKD